MSKYLKIPLPIKKDPPSADLLQGTLDMLILKIVALEPLHGYGIVQRIQQMSRDALQVRQGSLYPALYRLERRGLLEPEWRTNEGGREAKYYKLTKAGREALDKETEDWRRLRGAIDLILEGKLS
jgi:PadR family transcriptional regulator, regulatory protein PadR